jgi:hypothetical protein
MMMKTLIIFVVRLSMRRLAAKRVCSPVNSKN